MWPSPCTAHPQPIPPRCWTRTANTNTHRAYASAIDRAVARLGRDRPLAEVIDTEIGQALGELWGASSPATWNRNRAAVASWLAWCRTKMHWAGAVGPGLRRTSQGNRGRDPRGRQGDPAPAAVAPRHPALGCLKKGKIIPVWDL
ncbi:hypothetical protein [Nonomuraea basaltis]|uniref:hypothetical protein n=1 Tax=Nonomuraea basaltis TaxID=2495887 RepID=UPI001F0F89D9|nr:hypothetical protein [Nonomuraea basaltis]